MFKEKMGGKKGDMDSKQFQNSSRQTSFGFRIGGNKAHVARGSCHQSHSVCSSLLDKPAQAVTLAQHFLHFSAGRNVPLGPSMQLGRPSRSKSKFSLQIHRNKGPDRQNNLLGGEGKHGKLEEGLGDQAPVLLIF